MEAFSLLGEFKFSPATNFLNCLKVDWLVGHLQRYYLSLFRLVKTRKDVFSCCDLIIVSNTCNCTMNMNGTSSIVSGIIIKLRHQKVIWKENFVEKIR